jgi:hypothetical protein
MHPASARPSATWRLYGVDLLPAPMSWQPTQLVQVLEGLGVRARPSSSYCLQTPAASGAILCGCGEGYLPPLAVYVAQCCTCFVHDGCSYKHVYVCSIPAKLCERACACKCTVFALLEGVEQRVFC